jgi:uncharacterized protein (TIGR03435 family)
VRFVSRQSLNVAAVAFAVSALAVTRCLFAQAVAGKHLEFDAASIKPNHDSGPLSRFEGGFTIGPGSIGGSNISLRLMIREAYSITTYQLTGGPKWVDSDRFDLEAKAGRPVSHAELCEMLQTLLAKRFNLVVQHEVKEMPVYLLTVGKGGLKIPEWKPGDTVPDLTQKREGRVVFSMSLSGPMEHWAEHLSGVAAIGRPVIDKTGLQGLYAMTLKLQPQEELIPVVEEGTGLRFEAKRAHVDSLVITRVEKPSGN